MNSIQVMFCRVLYSQHSYGVTLEQARVTASSVKGCREFSCRLGTFPLQLICPKNLYKHAKMNCLYVSFNSHSLRNGTRVARDTRCVTQAKNIKKARGQFLGFTVVCLLRQVVIHQNDNVHETVASFENYLPLQELRLLHE